jgi:hypothetical protein
LATYGKVDLDNLGNHNSAGSEPSTFQPLPLLSSFHAATVTSPDLEEEHSSEHIEQGEDDFSNGADL